MTLKNNYLTQNNKKVIIVSLLLLIFFSMLKPSVFARSERVTHPRACIDIKMIGHMLTLFKAENYNYPTNGEGLRALFINPDINKYPNHRQYIKKEPIDPWGNPYHFVTTKEGFEVFSFGGDGKSGGEDNNKDVFYPECTFNNKSWFDRIFG